MEYTPYYALTFLTFSIIAAGLWSAHVGRSVWSRGSLAWRNFFGPRPAIQQQPDSPLHISRSRLYSLMSFGPSRARVLTLNLKNRGTKPVYSFALSYASADPVDTGALLSCPESLRPGQSTDVGIGVRGNAMLTLSIEFVQFADGTTWASGAPHSLVSEDEVRAGAQAAAEHLLAVWRERGASGVIGALPRMHADVSNPSDEGFGFYCGVTNTLVRVRDIDRRSRLAELEAVLRRQCER